MSYLKKNSSLTNFIDNIAMNFVHVYRKSFFFLFIYFFFFFFFLGGGWANSVMSIYAKAIPLRANIYIQNTTIVCDHYFAIEYDDYIFVTGC